MEIKIHNNTTCIIDKEDFSRVSKHKWYLDDWGYARRNKKFKDGTADSDPLRMHRFVLKTKSKLVVDHMNGNKLDNRKTNLRLCTVAQNNFGRGIKKDNTSGCKGVHFNKPTGKWMARISAYGKRKYLGLFKTKELAYSAYKEVSKELHGDFSNI